MFAQIDVAHAAATEMFEQPILAADDEAAPAPGQQLFCLERGQKALADEVVG